MSMNFKEPSIPTDVFNQPFKTAIAFFKSKLNMPTATWDTLLKEQHLKSFSVAGAVKEDLINDLRVSIDKIIEGGGTIADFRKDFDEIVARHGWGYNGAKAWRTRVMLQTNISVAHHRGHWQAMNSPAVKKARPYLRYLASSSRRRRPKHTAWVNTILPIDDPWWSTHYPPNGFGCKCGVVSMGKEDRDEFLKDEKDSKYPPRTTPKKEGTYNWKDSSGKTHKIPRHIDPGWDYNVGQMGAKDYIKGKGKPGVAPPAKAPKVAPDPKPVKFVPQKTAKAAEKWALDNNLADVVDYAGFDVGFANKINDRVSNAIIKHPEIRPGMNYIGTIQEKRKLRLKWQKENLSGKQKLETVGKTLFGEAETAHYGTNGISFNKNLFSKGKIKSTEKVLVESLDRGWFAEGLGTQQGIIDHEIGHRIHDYSSRDVKRKIKKYYEDNFKDIGSGVSRYASYDDSEFAAECYAEYMSNPKPRIISREIMEIMGVIK